MPCLVALLAIAMPRLAIILVLIFSDFLGRAYETLLWPVLGFVFLPLTTLAYAFGINRSGSIAGWYLVLVVLAVLVDLGMIGGGGDRAKRRRR